jgi:hypothetical protein
MCKLAFEKLSSPTCRVLVKATERTVCLQAVSSTEQGGATPGTAEVLDHLAREHPG